MYSLYPICADLEGRGVLVVGGGRVARRKVAALVEAGAAVTVVAPRTGEELKEAARDGQVEVLGRPYHRDDLEGKWLVVAATDDSALNRTISDHAEAAGLFCNVVDEPQLCSFQVPAVARQGLLQIAVSTGGACPALAKRIRRWLEKQFGPSYGRLLEGLSELRDHLKRAYPRRRQRRKELLESFLDSEGVGAFLRDGELQNLEDELERWKSL